MDLNQLIFSKFSPNLGSTVRTLCIFPFSGYFIQLNLNKIKVMFRHHQIILETIWNGQRKQEIQERRGQNQGNFEGTSNGEIFRNLVPKLPKVFNFWRRRIDSSFNKSFNSSIWGRFCEIQLRVFVNFAYSYLRPPLWWTMPLEESSKLLMFFVSFFKS